MARILSLSLVAGLFVGSAVAQSAVGRPFRDSRAPNTLRVLNQRIPEIRFVETPFEQVMDWLADYTELNVVVRWQTLEDMGVERDAPITVEARNLRLTQVLWLIMNEAGGSDIRLAYRASGALLILSTAEDLDKEMITKVYDISDLLVQPLRATAQQSFDVTQGMGSRGGRGGGSGGGGAGGGMFGGGRGRGGRGQGGYNNEDTTETTTKGLVDLILQTVEPDSWAENGGLGTIFPFRGLLVVRNSIGVHQRLGGYVREDEAAGP